MMVVIAHEDGTIEPREIEGNLKALQDCVGGYIEIFRLGLQNVVPGIIGYVNDNPRRLAPNRTFPIVCGPVVAAKVIDGSEVSLTNDEVELVRFALTLRQRAA